MPKAIKTLRPDTLKARVRTERVAMDIDGTLDGALPDVFAMIGTAARREAVLAKFNEVHARLCNFESERAAIE